jgi:N-acetylmuramic acid 6-phosphate etherase
MSNLQARNSKLRARAVRILMAETDLDENAAAAALDAGNGDIRIALVMNRTGCNAEAAKKALDESRGVVTQAINELSK